MKNLGGDTELARKTVGAFMAAFALVVPSGMKNSFINQHAPDFLLAVARPNNDGQSLANAFEKGGARCPQRRRLCRAFDQGAQPILGSG